MGGLAAAVLEAVERWRAMDGSAWGTGLSPAGVRAAQEAAAALIRDGAKLLGQPRGRPPRRLLIWCAGNVFTAALEWTALFAALGSEVRLKAPSRCPAPVLAIAAAFAPLGVRARALPHAAARSLIEGVDAVLGFGSDAAMAELSAWLPPGLRRSLHGHRVSFAVVSGDPAAAAGLALDAALYDGAGCMSPSAALCLGDPGTLVKALSREMAAIARRIPRGAPAPGLGPEWRRRCGLARMLGRCEAGPDWAVPLLPPEQLTAGPLPRMLPVHPIRSLEQLAPLAGLPLSTCATDLPEGPELEALIDLGFDRVCAPGAMQRPPLGRPHDGVDVIAALSRQIARG